MKPVDKVIQNDLIPSIIRESITENERQFYSLPVRSRGIGIPVFSEKAENDFDNSVYITAPLVAFIVTQKETFPNKEILNQRIGTIKRNNSNQLSESELLPDMKRAVLQTKEKGASSWLTVIPKQEHAFALAKSKFRDGLQIQYNKQLQGMPSKCPCSQKYDLNHAMNCKRGGFVVTTLSNVRDFEANLLIMIQNDVEIEPDLQKIDN